MSKSAEEHGLRRREFMTYALALGSLTAATAVTRTADLLADVPQRALDPFNPDILFGTTSSLWNQHHDIEWGIKRIAALGLQGIETYGVDVEKYRGKPAALRTLFDESGITFIDSSNGEKGQSTNFIDRDAIPKTIADHVAFARDFLQPLGAHHWKCNLGNRPAGGAHRRSAQKARRRAQPDWQADVCDGHKDGSASPYMGADGARIRRPAGDGAY